MPGSTKRSSIHIEGGVGNSKLETALNHMKNCKASGEDQITGEMLKIVIETFKNK